MTTQCELVLIALPAFDHEPRVEKTATWRKCPGSKRSLSRRRFCGMRKITLHLPAHGERAVPNGKGRLPDNVSVLRPQPAGDHLQTSSVRMPAATCRLPYKHRSRPARRADPCGSSTKRSNVQSTRDTSPPTGSTARLQYHARVRPSALVLWCSVIPAESHNKTRSVQSIGAT